MTPLEMPAMDRAIDRAPAPARAPEVPAAAVPAAVVTASAVPAAVVPAAVVPASVVPASVAVHADEAAGQKVNLLGLDRAGLLAYCETLGEKPFRALQLLRWIHHRGVGDWSAMTDLAHGFRERLGKQAVIAAPAVLSDHTAADATRKWLFDVGNGNAVEAVFIPEARRGTLCISTQAGCAVNCRFCSTGKQGFSRNLDTAEILGQIWAAERLLSQEGAIRRWHRQAVGGDAGSAAEGEEAFASDYESDDDPDEGAEGAGAARGLGAPGASAASGASPGAGRATRGEIPDGRSRAISNVVFMGMGEPLLNYDALLPALRALVDDHGYGLSRRRVTVSTSGVVPMIDRLAADCPVALAVSLHAGNDPLRNELVPLNRKYPLAELMAACRRYLRVAPRDFITFEYVMLRDINDSVAQARELVDLVREVPCKFNLIPFNPFPESGLVRSLDPSIARFADVLGNAGIVTTVRKTRGGDIDAACGQLAGEVVDRTRLKDRTIRILDRREAGLSTGRKRQ